MKKIIKYIILLFTTTLLSSCSQEVGPSTDNFVVEGFIVTGQPVDNIKIKDTSPIEVSNPVNEPIEDAIVKIVTSTDSYPLNYNSISQKYEYPESDLQIINGETYTLEVTRDDRTATGITTVPQPPTGLRLSNNQITIPSIELSFFIRDTIRKYFEEKRVLLEWDRKENQAYFVVIEHLEPELAPILPPQVPDEAKDLLADFRFISAPTEEPSFEIIGIALETYGKHIAKVYTVNQEYVDLYESSQQDSRDLNEPPSNIINAQGIFTGFAIASIEFDVIRD